MYGHNTWLTGHLDPAGRTDPRTEERQRQLTAVLRLRRRDRARLRAERLRCRADAVLHRASVRDRAWRAQPTG